jgi:cytidylate kinase
MERKRKGENMSNKRIVKKIRSGERDERDAIRYYKSFTPAQRALLTDKERKELRDAEEDEKEHLAQLKNDERRIKRFLKRK